MFKTFVSFVNYDARSLKIINSHYLQYIQKKQKCI